MGRTHLTLEQRYKIQTMLETGHTQKGIAEHIGVDKSTLSREIKRNGNKDGSYKAKTAQRRTEDRRKDKGAYKLKGKLEKHVRAKMKSGQWSPEQVSQTLPEHLGRVSHEAIYLFIYKDKKKGGKLHENLRWGRKERRKRLAKKDMRGQIKNAVSIEERPEVVGQKARVGDWEADLVELGKRSGYVLTLVERKTKFLLTALLPNKRSATVTAAIVERFRRTSLPVHTVTYDNGKEFAGHEMVNKNIKCASYFCHPYCSWERGLNENTNGLLRQYIPKGQTLAETSWQDLRTATNKLNDRPRKTLNWQTPREYSRNII
jgi:IS30 family transposase